MFSMPPASAQPARPDQISSAALASACAPEPQTRLTVSAGTAGLFARVLPGSETPDVQYHFLPFSTAKTMLELHDFPGMTISACQLRPESRGTITLASPDPMQKALIQANYLATETDRRYMVEGIKLGRRLAHR